MRRLIELKTLPFIIFAIFFIQGCGNGEEQAEKPQQAETSSPISTQGVQYGDQVILDEMKIENIGYEKDLKNPVIFSHKKHNQDYEITCVECHHVYEYEDDPENAVNVWVEGDFVEKCITCHDPNTTQGEQGEIQKLNLAYHNNCKTCHKEIVEEETWEEVKPPYLICTGCHI